MMDNNTNVKGDRTTEGFKKWTSFYRANPHRFAEDYLGLRLHIFQKIIIYMMNLVSFMLYVASRGQGKSYLVAIYCVIRCILYPNTNIALSSGTKGQARLIISEKVQQLYNDSPNLQREIKDIRTGQNDSSVTFFNGSKILSTTSGDGSRGIRCNILIIDESRLVSKEALDEILRPFLNVNRQPPYLRNPKYQHLQEENKEIHMSSAWYKNSELYSAFKSYMAQMIKGKDYFVCDLNEKLSMHHGLLSEKRLNMIKSEDDFNPTSYAMEYEGVFIGESDNAYFNLDDISKNRTLKKAFTPLSTQDYLEYKEKNKKKSSLPKQSSELRIVSLDVAVLGGKENDLSAFHCIRLLPNGYEEYERHDVYIETMSGQHSQQQAIRLRQLYEDFEADYIVLDTMGAGISIFDALTRILYDQDRDIEYEPFCCMNDEKMNERAEKDSVPVIYSVKASAELNHKIAVQLRNAFQNRKLKLLINDIEARENLIEKKALLKKSAEDQTNLLKPYMQTTALVNELINLEYEVRGGYIKIKEVGNATKDRYSSLAYANYFANILEQDLRKDDNKGILDYCMF